EERQRRWFFYGQGTYRVNPRLTLIYGLRWEIYFPQTVASKGEGAWLDPTTGLLNIAGYGHTNLHGNVKNNFTNFGPLVGLAYRLGLVSVLRAGYRRTFDTGLGGLIFGDTVSQNYPI